MQSVQDITKYCNSGYLVVYEPNVGGLYLVVYTPRTNPTLSHQINPQLTQESKFINTRRKLSHWPGLSLNKAMHMKMGNQERSNCLNIASINCEKGFTSQGKVREIAQYMEDYNIDLMGVAEIEMTKTKFHHEDLYEIQGYKIVKPKSWEKHGRARMVVYMRKSLEEHVKILPGRMSDDQPDVWLELNFPTMPTTEILFYYREWTDIWGNKGKDSQEVRLDKIMQEVNRSRKHKWIIGDLNIRWEGEDFKDGGESITEKLRDGCALQNMSQLIREVTRCRVVEETLQESIIDHIWTNNTEKLIKNWVSECSFSDHNYIGARLRIKTETHNYPITFRNFKNFPVYNFRADLSMHEWSKIYETEDVDKAAEILESYLLITLDKHAPERTILMSKKKNLKLTEETLKRIKERNIAKAEMKRTRTKASKDNYKLLRNRVVGLIKKEKARLIFDKSSTQKGAWSLIKSREAGLDKKGPPRLLVDKGTVIKKDKDIADHMQTFFMDKVRKNNEIAAEQLKPYEPEDFLKTTLGDKQIAPFELKTITEEKLEKILESLNNSKGAGLDGLSNQILKISRYVITKPLTHIINLSIQRGIVPQRWKQGKVIPLWKKSDPTIASNFRPISMLQKVSLCLETVILEQLTGHFREHKLFHKNQHGYITGKSTITACLTMYHRWVEAVNMGKYAGIMAIDLRGAFETICHTTFLKKMAVYGATDNTLKWLESYLRGRKQVVQIGKQISREETLPSGCPQGSKLGPVLFNIYTAELAETMTRDSLDIFADDSCCTSISRDPEEIIRNLNSDARSIENWLKSNSMIIAEEKSEFMLATSGRRKRDTQINELKIKVGGKVVAQKHHLKVLGIIFDSNLKFNTHMHGVQNKKSFEKEQWEKGLHRILSERAWTIRRLSSWPSPVKRMLGMGLFTSRLTFGCQIWGGLPSGELRHLQKQQTNLAKIITGDWRQSQNEVLKKCNWLNVENLIKFHTMILFYNIRTRGEDGILKSKLTSRRMVIANDIPDYSENMLEIMKNSFIHRGIKTWNQLNTDIRSSLPSEFKGKLLRHLMAQQV